MQLCKTCLDELNEVVLVNDDDCQKTSVDESVFVLCDICDVYTARASRLKTNASPIIHAEAQKMKINYHQCKRIIKDLLTSPRCIKEIDTATTAFARHIVSRTLMINLHKDRIRLLPSLTRYVWI